MPSDYPHWLDTTQGSNCTDRLHTAAGSCVINYRLKHCRVGSEHLLFVLWQQGLQQAALRGMLSPPLRSVGSQLSDLPAGDLRQGWHAARIEPSASHGSHLSVRPPLASVMLTLPLWRSNSTQGALIALQGLVLRLCCRGVCPVHLPIAGPAMHVLPFEHLFSELHGTLEGLCQGKKPPGVMLTSAGIL